MRWSTSSTLAPSPTRRRGVGDLEGIRATSTTSRGLGVDAIWLSPFFRSPMADFGYDVADYCDVDPLFGTLDDFDRLLADAHGGACGCSSTGCRTTPPTSTRGSSSPAVARQPEARLVRVARRLARHAAEQLDGDLLDGRRVDVGRATGQWYLHCFLPEQPDLNWANPEVVEAMHDVVRFWLDRGVDGFRIDVVQCMGKTRPARRPARGRRHPPFCANDCADTHPSAGPARCSTRTRSERMMVGEVYLLSTARVATYYGAGDELHLAFNFPPAPRTLGRGVRASA